MKTPIPNKEELLDLARSYVSALEEDDETEAERFLAEISSKSESKLYVELGKLTREFHDALNSFKFDDRMSNIAASEIPDAKERLNFVITKTEDAAHKTLDELELVSPLINEIGKRSADFSSQWERFTRRESTPEEFRALSKNLQAFFDDTDAQMKSIQEKLNQVVLAQDFQDITGQIIKRVISLVSELETSLVKLVRLGSNLESDNLKTESKGEKLAGPQIPGLESDSALSGQDEVDDLLSSLGF